MTSKLKPAIFTANDPTAPRVCPELAAEIGLNESMILLQLEFWIRLSGKKQEDGRFWIYESLTDFQEIFSFLSGATINRAIHNLHEKKLIHIGNFNKLKFDRTRWFALNADEVAKLESVRIVTGWAFQDDTSISQNDTRTNQNDTSSAQNETTIPDLSSDLSTDIPPSGEKFPSQQPETDDDIKWKTPSQAQPKPKGEYLQGLRNAVGGDVLEGVQKAYENVQPDEWQATADVFCACLHGFRLSDTTEADQKNWPRRLKTIAEEIGVSSEQMVTALRVMPEKGSGVHWKIPGAYSTPFVPAFKDDIKIVILKLATGQLQPKGQQSTAWSGSL